MAHYYIAQNSAGSNTGVDAANARAKSWFETSGNWSGTPGTSGKISPGDTVHLCGAIDSLAMQGSGTIGNRITLYWEPGAKITSAHGNLLSCTNRSHVTLDGGLNGIIENTDNGTSRTYQTVTKGVEASGISNFTIQNLTLQNLYVHVAPGDSTIDFTTGGGIYANGYGANVLIQNCDFSDICWCIIMFGSTGGYLTVDHCEFANFDHGIGGVSGVSSAVAGFSATFNHFGSTANWDATNDGGANYAYHHDGIHTFWGPGGGIPNAIIYGNRFDGDWGYGNTAHLFFEGNYNTHDPSECAGWLIANNVHVQYAGNYLNNGFMAASGYNAIIANNTYYGTGAVRDGAGGGVVSIGGHGVTFKNNLIINANRFIELGLLSNGAVVDYNIYATAAAGGNSPFYYNGTPINTFSAWKAALGQESHSAYLSSVTINLDGSLPIGSAAIDAGESTGLSAIGALDVIGTARPKGVAWDVGAYEYDSGSGGGGIATPRVSRRATAACVGGGGF
jgi:hypothetical protein